MTNGGFGFGFNPHDDDDEDRNNENNSGFGAFGFGGNFGGAMFGGDLGSLLNQFGQMLSGMGSNMNSPGSKDQVNYEILQKTARQRQGDISPVVSENEETAVRDAVHLADLWLSQVTEIAPITGQVVAWSPVTWLEETLPMWKRLIDPVTAHMNQAQLDSMPEEAREMLSQVQQVMGQMTAVNFGMSIGHALGDLSKTVLSGGDFGIPVAPSGVTALLPQAITELAKEFEISVQEVIVYVAAREAARQRLFQHVPWLVESMVSAVEEYAAGLEIDNTPLEDAARELNVDFEDPSSMQEIMESIHNMNATPKVTSRNIGALPRLETLLALIEGWVDYVVKTALSDRIPSTAALDEAWRRRRATGSNASWPFSKVVSIEFDPPKVNEAAELWRRIDNAVGSTRRDAIWEHPDFIPTAADLENSASFIDSLLDDIGLDNFDPIGEIEALEKRLAAENKEAEKEDPTAGDDSDLQDPPQQ
ncbi:zinc-dependent metalloprotease [Corynebacterium caspium]|uniref:zinc-dependent metalloprotease n=1 Tax=Corynebacterium caspium TaxID=234828 RepID=UPI0003810D65|nr:zinc-dependent metalloprotease [Corynebacterium caspium]WKD59685.1 hypothetical protein CCASP_06530 [Corynebacterium caspium DSM 44850]